MKVSESRYRFSKKNTHYVSGECRLPIHLVNAYCQATLPDPIASTDRKHVLPTHIANSYCQPIPPDRTAKL